MVLALLATGSVWAQNPYDLASVPENLKARANVITHIDHTVLEVESIEKSQMKVKKAFTVLNEEGRGHLVFQEYTSKYNVLTDAEIKVIDKNGKQVNRYKKKDMNVQAIGEGLIDDGYVTYLVITPPSYPVTVEISYEIKFQSTLNFPAYHYMHSKESTIESSYTVKIPADINLRYKAVNTEIKPEITEDAKYKTYKWSVKNIPPAENEEGAVASQTRFAHVKIAADKFSHYGYRGELTSWNSFGGWIHELFKGMDELPAERQQYFQDLVKDAPDDREKIRRLYEYMQENFRYVSIQLGIGGYKPFSATFTDEKKYGDCKALSNYMKAALKAVGIRSHVAIINAAYNQEPVDPDFPSNNFNHAILCVPGKKDSVWLECTSNTADFAQLGTFTENRNALLLTETGGVLVATPKSEAAANSFSSFTKVKMDKDLTALTETKITSTGWYREVIFDMLKDNKDDQKNMIVWFLGFKQPDDFVFESASNDRGHVTSLKMAVRKLPEFNSGNKFFLNPRVNKIWSSKLPVYENRKLDFYFPNPFVKKDTTVILLPEGFAMDALPKEKELKCDYATYKSATWFNEKENALYTSTTLVLKNHKVLAKDYKQVKTFFDDVLQDDSQRIVVKGTVGEPEKKAF